MSQIKVDINIIDGEIVISIMNDGSGIPIYEHAEEKVFIPELIFGHLLTSSNFNDATKRLTGGRHGLIE